MSVHAILVAQTDFFIIPIAVLLQHLFLIYPNTPREVLHIHHYANRSYTVCALSKGVQSVPIRYVYFALRASCCKYENCCFVGSIRKYCSIVTM